MKKAKELSFMPFGARETLEAHEMLEELKVGIEHIAYYARHCEDDALRGMLERHTERMKAAYNRLLGYAHDYSAAAGRPPEAERPDVGPSQIRYGLRHPEEQVLRDDGRGGYPPAQLARYALHLHKSGAKNAMAAALECADRNVRDILQQMANDCAAEAYELFLLLNEQGKYQVPTMRDHTAKTYLHPYQPSGADSADTGPAATPLYRPYQHTSGAAYAAAPQSVHQPL